MRAPEFWDDPAHPLGRVLAPLGAIYHALGALRRAAVRPQSSGVPVVCIGNLIAGGAGKTPVVLAIGRRLTDRNITVHFLTRGYGGREAGPVRVDLARHEATQVGDEALLLADVAPTWVSRDRVAGARAAVDAGAQLIIMDDGFQNPSLSKDLSLVVVDTGYGFGNRRLVPAGPLREPIAAGLGRADALVLLGGDGPVADLSGGGLPILAARLVPGPSSAALRGRRVLAFAGIARPQKFFDTLAEIGCDVVDQRAFADHHPFDPDEIMTVCEAADAVGAVPVTTAKDAVRLPPEARPMVEVVEVSLEWRDPKALERVLRGVVHRATQVN